jgi:hypothetical protein
MRWRTKIHDPFEWHDWFAWYPVNFIDDIEGDRVTVWLETVERREKKHLLGYLSCGVEYEYRTALDFTP